MIEFGLDQNAVKDALLGLDVPEGEHEAKQPEAALVDGDSDLP